MQILKTIVTQFSYFLVDFLVNFFVDRYIFEGFQVGPVHYIFIVEKLRFINSLFDFDDFLVVKAVFCTLCVTINLTNFLIQFPSRQYLYRTSLFR